ncbi:major tail protein [Lacticaseibacillus yichunensis]|uniref:Major tail protein n=1 Tax=Lacticaseibacillus yichunensis TaxID=2486015 RepID=A0ABW4CPC2_9LACO|nr:major tail protein [Lacticaseibacillus yichunensis]
MTKVKFGVSHAEYGVVKGDLVADETKKLPGMTSATLEITAEVKTLAADDGPYVTVSGGISEAKLSLENYDIGPDAQKDFYGIETVGGVALYNKSLVPNDIAFLLKTRDEEGKGIWVAVLKAKFTLPGIDVKTVDGTPDPTADKIEGTAAPRGDSDTGNMILIGRESDPDFNFEQFHKCVFPKTSDEAEITVTPASGVQG